MVAIERDKHAAIVYQRSRFYNPEQGRFLTLDSHPGNIREPRSLHKYLYANADPVMMVDPSGMNADLASMLGTIGAYAALTVGGLGALGFTALPLFRGANVFAVDAQLPTTLSTTEVLYHSAEIQGSPLSIDQAFKRVASLTDLPASEIVMTGLPTGVGSILNFRLTPIKPIFGQRPFNVRVVRYDLADHIMVVETLAGHPLSGWRAWQVTQQPNGNLLVETWSVDEPATKIEGVKFNNLDGAESQSNTWTGLLSNVATSITGQVVGGVTAGERFPSGQRSQEYFNRYGIAF
ncbi:MAG: RHS repeat-associated core domain-containing protein [Pirellulales bacterium]